MDVENIIEFNKLNIKECLKAYSSYRKCYGLLTASMCYLPIVTDGFIVNGVIDQGHISYLQEKYGEIIMCRMDTPFKHWGGIPRGRDVMICDLNKHYSELKKCASEFILLCFKHPSTFFTNGFVDRWKIYGGINVLILWNQHIVIEYVGKGFDVGDLSRGIDQGHQTIDIQWNIRNRDTKSIWEAAKITTLPDEGYTKSRNTRISSLLNMGYELNTLEKNLPLTLFPVSFCFFKNLYQNCIAPVINKRKLFLDEVPITIQINAYSDEMFHVFEIWESDK